MIFHPACDRYIRVGYRVHPRIRNLDTSFFPGGNLNFWPLLLCLQSKIALDTDHAGGSQLEETCGNRIGEINRRMRSPRGLDSVWQWQMERPVALASTLRTLNTSRGAFKCLMGFKGQALSTPDCDQRRHLRSWHQASCLIQRLIHLRCIARCSRSNRSTRHSRMEWDRSSSHAS